MACMTPEQCRAARGWLALSQQKLADQASVSLSTVKDFEAGRRTPIGNNLTAMVSVLEGAGIAFTEVGINGPSLTETA